MKYSFMLIDSIMKAPKILDDYKMGMTFTAMPNEIGIFLFIFKQGEYIL